MDNKLKIKNLLILQNLPNIGVVNAKKIIAYSGGIEQVFLKKRKELLAIPGIANKIVESIINHHYLEEIAEEEIAFLIKNNIFAYTYLDFEYPDKLKVYDDAPLIIFSKTPLNVNKHKIISIVGTRNASDYGKKKHRKTSQIFIHI